jgi:hypothetical protein
MCKDYIPFAFEAIAICEEGMGHGGEERNAPVGVKNFLQMWEVRA